MTESKLNKLKVQRGVIILQLDRAKEFLDQRSETATLAELKTRLEFIEKQMALFSTIQTSIEQLDDAETKANTRSTFEETYFTVQPALVTLIESRKQKIEGAAFQTSVRLPRISLPTFNGDITEWLSYCTTFKTLVHNDKNLNNIQRFQYLRSTLTGSAIKQIQSLELTDENYKIALQILCDRYDNKRYICQAHIQSLMDIKPLDHNKPAKVRELIDKTNVHLRALESLNRPTKQWDDLLVHSIVLKMDSTLRLAWEKVTAQDRLPTLKELLTFLHTQCQISEATSKAGRSDPAPSNAGTSKKPFNSLVSLSRDICTLCKGTHGLYKCPQFLNKSIEQRIVEVNNFKLCKNCLHQGHESSACRSSGRCRVCKGKHHSLIHFGRTPNSERQGSAMGSVQSAAAGAVVNNNARTALCSSPSATRELSYIFLATALIHVLDIKGNSKSARAILDSASQLNFITDELVRKLGLQKRKVALSVLGIGGNNNLQAKYQTTFTIKSRISDYACIINAVVVPTITSSQPSSHINTEEWNIPRDIQLADPRFNEPQAVDILIGAELHYQLLQNGQISLHPKLPILQRTFFGWIVSGKSATETISNHSSYLSAISTTSPHTDDQLADRLKEFWELEHYPNKRMLHTKEELLCEQHFLNNYRRDSEGRFIVQLPFKQVPNCLGDSFEMAKRRFFGLERRIHKDPKILKLYSQFMDEYLTLKHMRPVELNELPEPNYFLPHHAVLKPDSSTTKLRVVFDASAKSTTNYSLNDILMVGPTVQDDLFSVIVRFRIHVYVITADITKMYRQIQIAANDQRFQNIIWRNNPGSPLQIFQLSTVTYGTASAPFLATKCLQQLATEEEHEFPRASAIVKRDFYVDDLITGGDTIESVSSLPQELTSLLSKGGLQLQKWCSNRLSLLEGIPVELREKYLKFNNGDVVKTLGLIWQPEQDILQFQVNINEPNAGPVNKRTILSQLSKIFDPLGLLNPIILLGKIFMQQLWQLNISWDEPIPSSLQKNWSKYYEQLKEIEKIEFSRRVICSESHASIQLHAFSDASQVAYGTCVYVRSIDKDNNISVALLCAKSRVAPIKQITLPRLELCAAELMAKLVDKLQRALNIPTLQIFYWTDSTIVLSWLSEPSSNWETFVGNRVALIQDLTDINSWHHIDTKQNPADLVSRGALPTKLKNSSLWFQGPDFITQPMESWPLKVLEPAEDVPGRKKLKSVLLLTTTQEDLIEQSKWKNWFTRLLNVFTYIFRFYDNCHLSKNKRKFGVLSPAEREKGLKGLLKLLQRIYFKQEYTALSHGLEIDRRSIIKNLSPFLDGDDIIRVGGRLENSDLTFDAKHQIILPAKHAFTKALMAHLHHKHMHAGPQTLLNITRQRYWPLNGRNIAKQIVNVCVRCFRTKPRSIDQLMGNLPNQRVLPARAFFNSGVDVCGPVHIHFKIRGKVPVKAYIVIFVCFTTKAVHIELASDLSTAAFIAALKRFIGRRGICANLFCDNATNFAGANKELSDLRKTFTEKESQDEILKMCANDNISFHFIPPRSPHFGGLWEAAVKLTKYHLRRVLRGAILTYEELNTVLIQIEAILNSRPLSPLSNNPNDVTALTPGHFLIGEPLTALPEVDIKDSNLNLLQRWRRIQWLQQQFWDRWRKDYLNQLQTRLKWKGTSPNIKVDQVVIVKEDNVPPMKWLLARVVEVCPGQDNMVRVVKLKTVTGLFKRPITKICPLPLPVNEHN